MLSKRSNSPAFLHRSTSLPTPSSCTRIPNALPVPGLSHSLMSTSVKASSHPTSQSKPLTLHLQIFPCGPHAARPYSLPPQSHCPARPPQQGLSIQPPPQPQSPSPLPTFPVPQPCPQARTRHIQSDLYSPTNASSGPATRCPLAPTYGPRALSLEMPCCRLRLCPRSGGAEAKRGRGARWGRTMWQRWGKERWRVWRWRQGSCVRVGGRGRSGGGRGRRRIGNRGEGRGPRGWCGLGTGPRRREGVGRRAGGPWSDSEVVNLRGGPSFSIRERLQWRDNALRGHRRCEGIKELLELTVWMV